LIKISPFGASKNYSLAQQITQLNNNLTTNLGLFTRFKGLVVGEYTKFSDVPTGFYAITGAISAAMTDKPTGYTSGRCFLLKSKISDGEFMLMINPHSGKMWLNTYYGSWSGWKAITMA